MPSGRTAICPPLPLSPTGSVWCAPGCCCRCAARPTLPVRCRLRVLPDGVTVRAFRPGDDDVAFLGVNARAFAWHPEQGRLDQAGLAAEMAQDWFDPAGFFLAVDADDTVLGFHWTKVHSSDPRGRGPIGEVYVLGVDPLSPIRGLGTPLTIIGLEHLAQHGLSTVMLYVEGDNDRALTLYRKLGFDVAGTDVVYRRDDAV